MKTGKIHAAKKSAETAKIINQLHFAVPSFPKRITTRPA
jgi:hypothetical protein